MNIRTKVIAAVIALLLSGSALWGARLITSQAPQTQTKAPADTSTIQQPSPSPAPGDQALPKPKLMRMRKTMSEPAVQAPQAPMPSPQLDKPEREVTSKGGKQFVTMDFDGVDIKVFVKFIADITNRNFIIDDKVNGKVTVISPRKMSTDEAYQVFLSVLDVNGFATVNMGSVVKVVLATDAVSKSIGTSMTAPKRREDVLITQIIPLKHADANDMKALFQPLLTKGSSQLMSYPQSNMLIITDTKSNIKKMMEILKFIDVTGFSEDFRIFPLAHASAADLSAKLTEILSDKGQQNMQGMRAFGPRAGVLSERGKARIIPYERTNSLIVLASAIDMSGIESLVQKLDIPTPSGKEDIHVYYLQYARAEDIVKVLTDMPTPNKNEGAPAAAAPGAPEIAQAQRGMRSSTSSDKVKISSDKETNSLIIFADPDAYSSILDTIKYLDIPRKQVYVKAAIMEVNQNKNLNFGVEWTFFEDFTYDGGKRVGGAFGRSGNKFYSSLADLPSGALLGVVGEAITVTSGSTSITFPNMTTFINAMATDTDVHILATPQIITMDNKEAEIKVGANVPYLTREQADTTNLNNTVRTFDYRDIGVTLRLTPQINQQGNIRLEIFQENTSLVEGTGEQQYAPTTLKRSAKTTVTVKDGTNIVIGGLIGDTITGGESGIPLLKDIPLLGHLFKSNSRKTEKTNLYIFLSPKIIDSDEKASALYNEKYGDISATMTGEKDKKDKDKDKGKK